MKFSSASESGENGQGRFVRFEKHTVRTSLNALVTAYTGIRIFESHVFVPKKADLPYDMFRTLSHTLPASHASTWIHGYILS